MQLKLTPSKPSPANHAEERVQHETDCFAKVIHAQAARPIETAGCLWPGLPEDAREAIRQACAELQHASPIQASTKEQAAAHEAGHFVAYQATSMGAASAEIDGSKYGHAGWSGSASQWNRPVKQTNGGVYPFTAEQVLGEVVSCVAGLANELRVGGDFFSSSGEVIEACVLARAYGDMKKIGLQRAMVDVLTCTTALLDRYAPNIRGVADVLIRRKRITCFERSGVKLLAAVSTSFLAGPWPCDHGRLDELVGFFERAPIDLSVLVRKIAP